ncbi:MAG TPA: GNAT family N-acetyltransferase [Anaerolineae bacterium]|nr:GNAT family N-acetyltransferase [Anaerolineae bacterium]
MLRARPRAVIVAEDSAGAGLSGYAMGTVAENEPFSVPRYGYMACLYVGRERRDRGMGDALLEAAQGRFKQEGLEATHVDVSCRDMAAQRFWQNRGFRRFLDHLWRSADSAVCAGEDPGFVVRPARSGDRGAVVLLWEEMMDIHAAIDSRLSIAPSWRAQVERSSRRWLGDRDNCLIVAEAVDDVVGFALGGLAGTTLGLTPGTYGHIAHMCVSAQWRRRGVGRQLFASLRDWFVRRGVPSIHLYVSCLNPVSQQFWRELGFEDYISRLWCDLV